MPACIILPLSSVGLKTRSRRKEWMAKASPEVLKDCVYVISLYLLDGLPKPPCEVSYGFLFMLYNSLQRTNVPLQVYRTKILRDECTPKLIERVY